MTTVSQAKCEIFANADVLAHSVADWLSAIAREKDGVVAVALAGGATPRGLYECLARPPHLNAFPWFSTHWFWGDERYVPHDDVRSNYHMAWTAMLSHTPTPPGNIHAIPTSGADPDISAHAYERELKAFYRAGKLNSAKPLFDVVLLGLGKDGHIASLFPGSPVLKECNRWVAAVEGPNSETRITLTYPALDSTRHVAFLVSGPEKQLVLSGLRQGLCELPAAHVRSAGTLHLFADAAATPAASS
jgi:6-phosphogluconolactonase